MTLDVCLHDRHVGVIEQEPSTRVISFTLDEGYLAERARPVLGQMFEDRRGMQQFRQSKQPGQLPAFFANLMPEGALKAVIEAQVPDEGALALLARIGVDLPGAVVVRASADMPPPQSVRKVFDEPLTEAPPPDLGWRFSLAGIQFKMSAVKDPDARFTLPFSRDGGRWILKFGSPDFPSLPENEFAVMRWAQRAGLDVPTHELVEARSIEGLDPRLIDLGERVFAIERYDRVEGGGRVHQEDFAQVNGLLPKDKYEHATYEGIGRVIGTLCGLDDLREYVRRVVFMVLSGNVDAHRKNWSLVYPDTRQARLSPAYDLVFVMMYPTVERRLALKLAGEKVPAAVSWSHFERVERFLRERGLDLPVVDEARAFVPRALDAWASTRADVDPALAEAISSHLASLQLARLP